jgi:hypothetical protein
MENYSTVSNDVKEKSISARQRILSFLREETLLANTWSTPGEIADALGLVNVASVSANLRNLRKPENGSYNVVERLRRFDNGVIGEYRLMPGTWVEPTVEASNVS